MEQRVRTLKLLYHVEKEHLIQRFPDLDIAGTYMKCIYSQLGNIEELLYSHVHPVSQKTYIPTKASSI